MWELSCLVVVARRALQAAGVYPTSRVGKMFNECVG